MGRASRTFKLRLSPAGMDLLIETHHRVILATRQLLPWGTTLHVAVLHLGSLPTELIIMGLRRIFAAGLDGAEVHYLGAPCAMNDIAAQVAARVERQCCDTRTPTQLKIYILALEIAASADLSLLCSVYLRLSADALCNLFDQGHQPATRRGCWGPVDLPLP